MWVQLMLSRLHPVGVCEVGGNTIKNERQSQYYHHVYET
jgi:hypothetical protein